LRINATARFNRRGQVFDKIGAVFRLTLYAGIAAVEKKAMVYVGLIFCGPPFHVFLHLNHVFAHDELGVVRDEEKAGATASQPKSMVGRL